jgi:hypothetical protein
MEDSDLEVDYPAKSPPRYTKAAVNQQVKKPVFADARCTCALGAPSKVKGRSPTPVKHHVPTPECEVKGRLPTPELMRSASPTRHHLDLTTPSENGLLIPVTTYPHVSPGFRRDMKSTAPINQLTADSVDRLIEEARKAAKNVVREEVSSVPKHIPASSSPHHSHCVPSGARELGSQVTNSPAKGRGVESHAASGGAKGVRRGESFAIPIGAPPKVKGRGTKSSHHIRKLNFERAMPSQPAPKRPQSTQYIRPSGMPQFSAHSLSCQTCGACLQPSVPPPPSSAPPGPVDERPRAQSPSFSQPRHVSAHNAGRASMGSQRIGNGREPSPTYGKWVGRSPTPPPSRATPAAVYRGSNIGLKPSYQRSLEVDELSLSSMSLSSCSVASEVLEKAKKRRDNFWTSTAPVI